MTNGLPGHIVTNPIDELKSIREAALRLEERLTELREDHRHELHHFNQRSNPLENAIGSLANAASHINGMLMWEGV